MVHMSRREYAEGAWMDGWIAPAGWTNGEKEGSILRLLLLLLLLLLLMLLLQFIN